MRNLVADRRSVRKSARRDDHTRGLFIVEKRADEARWIAVSTRRSARRALDCAWDLLTREGGDVRVRQGSRVVAEGTAIGEGSRRAARPDDVR